MEALRVPEPVWQLTWGLNDATRAMEPWVQQVTYTDHIHGQSDEIEIVLDNSDGRWTGAWYPVKGDGVDLKIGYRGQPLLPCGQFSIDEVVNSGSPDTVTLRGVAADVTLALRTRKSAAYESLTLADVADRVAKNNGLTLVGEVATVILGRVTQNKERDLAFLKRLAEDYGHAFTVKGKQLVFYDRHELAKQAPVVTIDKRQMISWDITDKLIGTFRAAQVSYHDPATKELKTYKVDADDTAVGDTLILSQRCESLSQAEAIAKAALKQANAREAEGTITVPGDPRLVAGNNAVLTGLGVLSGTYQIPESRHTLIPGQGGGYQSAFQVCQGVMVWQT